MPMQRSNETQEIGDEVSAFRYSGSEKPAIIDTQSRLRDLSEHLADITADSLSDQPARNYLA
jgi:hypothetical protein